MNKNECKVCSDGNLELRDLPAFPDALVRFLANCVIWAAGLAAAISLAMFAGTVQEASMGVTAEFGARVWVATTVEIAILGGCFALVLAGAVLRMERPRLQCNSCSATVAAH